MIKKDRISQGEGGVFDLKLNSGLSIVDNIIFPIIGFGGFAAENEHFYKIKKSIGFIFPEIELDTEKCSFVTTQESTLAKFNTEPQNIIGAVNIFVITLSKNILPSKLLYSNILSSSIPFYCYNKCLEQKKQYWSFTIFLD